MTRTKRQTKKTQTIILMGALSALTLVAHPAHADLIIEAQNSAALPGGMGMFDVDLVDTGGTYDVSGFSLEPTVSAASGVTFTGVSANTSAPYIFGTLQQPPLTFSTFPNTDFVASDSSITAPFETTLTTGSVYGLADVTYQIAAGTPQGTIPVTLNPANTMVYDINSNPITATIQNGNIAAVPEASSLALFALGLLPLGLIAAKWRNAAAPQA